MIHSTSYSFFLLLTVTQCGLYCTRLSDPQVDAFYLCLIDVNQEWHYVNMVILWRDKTEIPLPVTRGSPVISSDQLPPVLIQLRALVLANGVARMEMNSGVWTDRQTDWQTDELQCVMPLLLSVSPKACTPHFTLTTQFVFLDVQSVCFKKYAFIVTFLP